MHNSSTGPSHAPSHPTLDTPTWRKATRSTAQGSDCVEVARAGALLGIRDSKDPQGPKLALGSAAARALTAEIKQGRYDL